MALSAALKAGSLNGLNYTPGEVTSGAFAARIRERFPDEPFVQQCAYFITELFAPAPEVEVLTSGSTGTPKKLKAVKERMYASAAMTIEHLRLQEGCTALLCMPLEHIAGKMMVMRALTGGMALTAQQPAADPFAGAPSDLDFAAITPMQAYCTLQHAQSTKKMASCKNIIVGGGFIEPELERQLAALPGRFYHSYGMTETLSHIALRRLDGREQYFQPLPGVEISLSARGTLCIYAPRVNPQVLETNDLAKISKEGFAILGRVDNVINSGGVKLIPELIEKEMAKTISTPFAISARRSAKYGEEAVLVSEVKLDPDLLATACAGLQRYQRPKAVIVMELPRTATQKIDRPRLRTLLNA